MTASWYPVMPYWRLSGFYFFYFASLGALVPFWGLYLRERGLGPLAIGELLAILMATKIVAPNLWGWIADTRGSRMPIVRLASLLSLAIFTGIYLADGFWGMALVMTLFSFFWNASLPQMEAVTFNHLGDGIHRYGSIRVWGSIGFILAVVILGALIERIGTAVVPILVATLFLGVWVSSLYIPESRQEAAPGEQRVSLRTLLMRKEIAAFLLGCFLMQASHGAYYAFYSIHMTDAGYTAAEVGALWAWGVVVEVLVFLVMHRLMTGLGARAVLLASLALAVVRWLLTGLLVQLVWVQILAQAMHAATFGAYHAAAIHLVHRYFRGRTQGRGQALYSSLSFGAGGAAGSLLSGVLWSAYGERTTFAISAFIAALGWLTVWVWVDREQIN